MCKLFDCNEFVVFFFVWMRKQRCDAYLHTTFTSQWNSSNEMNELMRKKKKKLHVCKTNDEHYDANANLISTICVFSSVPLSFCCCFSIRWFSRMHMRKKLYHINSIWINWLSVWNALLLRFYFINCSMDQFFWAVACN